MFKIRINLFLFLIGVTILPFVSSCSNEDLEVTPSNSDLLVTQENALPSLGAKLIDYEELVKNGVYTAPKSLKALPLSVDLSSKFPPVGAQGNQGSCVGWAVGYYYKTFQEVKEMGWSPNTYIYSPSWVYNQINYGADNGAYIPDALSLIVNKGCDFLSNFPYLESNYTKKPDAASFQRASFYKAQSWRALSNNIDNLKQVLANGNAFVCGFNVYYDFDYLNTNNPVFDIVSGNPRGSHAVCVVGYDDSKQAFKIINSWGTSKGINGFYWISYALVSNGSIGFTAYELVDKVNIPTWYKFTPSYSATGQGPGWYTSFNSISLPQGGTVTQTYTMSGGTQYRASYTLSQSGTGYGPSMSLVNGKYLFTGTGAPGYVATLNNLTFEFYK